MKNAVVLPNGHIYVFTGILEDCPSEDVFGFLLGHECAHAVLRHAGEKISEMPFLEMLSTIVVSTMSLLVPEEFGATIFQGARAYYIYLPLRARSVPSPLLTLSSSLTFFFFSSSSSP